MYVVCMPLVFIVLYMCLAILIPMLFFQYGVVDVFPDDMGIDNFAASNIDFVMFASMVLISVHFMPAVAVVMCYR